MLRRLSYIIRMIIPSYKSLSATLISESFMHGNHGFNTHLEKRRERENVLFWQSSVML